MAARTVGKDDRRDVLREGDGRRLGEQTRGAARADEDDRGSPGDREHARRAYHSSMSASPASALHVEYRILEGRIGCSAALARDDVGGVPLRPVVLRSGRFVLAVMLLGLSQ